LPQRNFRQQKFCGPPEGRSDYGQSNNKTQNGTTRLFRRVSAIKTFQSPFLPYLFPQEGKDMARGAADAASQTAPRLRRNKKKFRTSVQTKEEGEEK